MSLHGKFGPTSVSVRDELCSPGLAPNRNGSGHAQVCVRVASGPYPRGHPAGGDRCPGPITTTVVAALDATRITTLTTSAIAAAVAAAAPIAAAALTAAALALAAAALSAVALATTLLSYLLLT